MSSNLNFLIRKNFEEIQKIALLKIPLFLPYFFWKFFTWQTSKFFLIVHKKSVRIAIMILKLLMRLTKLYFCKNIALWKTVAICRTFRTPLKLSKKKIMLLNFNSHVWKPCMILCTSCYYQYKILRRSRLIILEKFQCVQLLQ